MRFSDFKFAELCKTPTSADMFAGTLKNYPHFLDHLYGELCQLPKPKTIQDLWKSMPSEVAKANLIVSTEPYSYYSPLTQTKNPRFCSAVPLPLVAMRDTYGIPYEYWDLSGLNDSQVCFTLGLALGSIYQFRQVNKPVVTEQMRSSALIVKSTGKAISPLGFTSGTTGDKDFETLVKKRGFLKHMLLQTWIFHPSIRHPNMVTDIWDMNYTPESILDNEIPLVKKLDTSSTKDGRLPWE